MYTVIIAEDEDLIRESFKKFIPWQELGFNLAAEFNNGHGAVSYMEDHPVDLVLTDVRMDFGGGMEVAKYVSENCKGTHVGIITGFREFDVARKAIEYNVDFFLTKPTSFPEAIENIQKVKEKLDSERAVDDLIEAGKSQFFRDVFFGALREQTDIAAQAEHLGLSGSTAFFCPVDLLISNAAEYLKNYWHYTKEGFYDAVFNFVNVSKLFDIYKLVVRDEHMILLFVSENLLTAKEFRASLEKSVSEAKKSIYDTLELKISFSIGQVLSGIDELAAFTGSSLSFNEAAAVGEQTVESIQISEMYKSIFLHILLDQWDKMYSVFQCLKILLAEWPTDAFRNKLYELLCIISEKAAHIDGFEDAARSVNPEAILSSPDKEAAFRYAEEWMSRLCERATSHKKGNTSKAILARVKKYIAEHYREDISLEDIAEFVFLNASYLSRLFKRETGETFKEFLIRFRIEKAIELLKEGKYKIYEISELSGYHYSKYFIRQFRNIMGCSPSEYVQSLKNQGR